MRTRHLIVAGTVLAIGLHLGCRPAGGGAAPAKPPRPPTTAPVAAPGAQVEETPRNDPSAAEQPSSPSGN